MRRRLLVLALVAAAVVVALVAPLAVQRRSPSGAKASARGSAQAVLVPLPSGYQYAQLAPLDAAATASQLREVTGADDAVAVLVGTPQQLAPVGVQVVSLHFPRPPEPVALAGLLATQLPFADPQPVALAGATILFHVGDDTTFTAAGLWVAGATAVVAYGATTVEIDGVLSALIAGRK